MSRAKNKKATMKDIALQAGVSVAAVGSVLQGTGKNVVRTSEETSRRILKIAAELNYMPNSAARQLRGKPSNTIGVLMAPDALESNFIRLAEIEARANQNNYKLMVGYQHFEREYIKDYMEDFASRGIDGIICVHHAIPQAKELIPNMILEKFDSAVFIDQPAVEGANYVAVDFEKCGKDVANYLCDKGRRRVALVITDLKWVTGPNLCNGYKAALRENAIEISENMILTGEQYGYTDTTHLPEELADKIIDELVVRRKADAIMGTTDLWAARILNRLIQRGYRVPEDIAIVGHGNLYIGEYLIPQLTSVDLKYKEIAYNSVDMLLDIIKGGNKHDNKRILSVELVKRQSV